MPERKPESAVTIRPFESTDLERVRWLFARTPPWGGTYPRPQQLPDDLEDIPRNYPGGAFVALQQDMAGEAVVGFTAVALVSPQETISFPPFLPRRERASRVHWVSVVPERWRLGIGRQLTQVAIDWSRERGAEAVEIETTVQQEAAVELYRSLGFRELGVHEVGPWRQVWLELVL
jgi:ribosomal protein S18 acetylase RimI-like enzyme